MTHDDRPNKKPTAEQILVGLSPSARNALRSLGGSASSAAEWYNRLADVRAALKIGVEVMEKSAREEAAAAKQRTGHSDMKMIAASYALGTTAALECCMSIIEAMHPELLKARVSDDAPPKINGHRMLDLD